MVVNYHSSMLRSLKSSSKNVGRCLVRFGRLGDVGGGAGGGEHAAANSDVSQKLLYPLEI